MWGRTTRRSREVARRSSRDEAGGASMCCETPDEAGHPSMIASRAGVDAPDPATAHEPDRFDSGRVLGHVARLSFPRRVGTPAERRAARYILRAFDSLGMVRRREPFLVPYVAREVGVR